ncbi:hypothetical protein, partial [Mycobacterium marinum]|uniref:hypothetical protein n=1 Tax=Mycobacterium marinum TaxID=1781 RepID=UPI0021C3C723
TTDPTNAGTTVATGAARTTLAAWSTNGRRYPGCAGNAGAAGPTLASGAANPAGADTARRAT